MYGKRECGDYQTPVDFAEKICRFLRDRRQIAPSAILEPTCGVGNFLYGSLLFHAEKYDGIESNPEYCRICAERFQDKRVNITRGDIFRFDLRCFQTEKNLLVIGNPPWVNNSALSVLNSKNLPEKSNFKKLRGIDAITGSGNFDICEAVILRLIRAFRQTNTIIAMLCKCSVARNVFLELKREKTNFSSCEMIEFDAGKVFGVSADACILLICLTSEKISPDFCRVSFLEDDQSGQNIIYRNDKLYNGFSSETDMKDIINIIEGSGCFLWRQGVKHDCAKIMELTVRDGKFQNGLGEMIDIESGLVFPLIKSSMFKKPLITDFTKFVIVTQKKAGDDTAYIAEKFPKTWDYLQKNIKIFQRRKSVIYRKAPVFSMFGIGDYSYARYKVGVSGFYKTPLFSVLYSHDGKPVMTDDTSYFIPFDSYQNAYTAMLSLNSKPARLFLQSVSFADAKRPFTKKVLSGLDFKKLFDIVPFEDLKILEKSLGLEDFLTRDMREEFSDLLSGI